jgi:hypothetical protein
LTPELTAQAAGLIGVKSDGSDILPAERDLPDPVIEEVATAFGIDAKLAALAAEYGRGKD